MQPNTTKKRLSPTGKAVYALGDHTVNLALSAASLLSLVFLMGHGGLSPFLAPTPGWVDSRTRRVGASGEGAPIS